MLTLNPKSSVPLYKQLYHLLMEQINQGELKPGVQIPSEAELGTQYAVSRVTVRAAIDMMVKEGVLIKRHGVGTFVAMPVFCERKAGGSFTRSCQLNQVVPRTEVVSVKTIPASKKVAEHLKVDEMEPVHQVCRIRYTDFTPVIYEIDYFRKENDFVLQADLMQTKMSDLILKETGYTAKLFEDTFDVIMASEDAAAYLKCRKKTPLLAVYQTVLTENSQVLYYNEQYIISERYKYMVAYN